MLFVFVDTNIWIRVLSQGRPGCEIEHFEELRELQHQSKIQLIVPEIVELEFEKNWRGFRDQITASFLQLDELIRNAVKQKKLWTEIEDVHDAIASFLREKKDAKTSAAEERSRQILELFASLSVVKIPLTPELLFLGKKRLIAGRMPSSENTAHNDACIIETLVSFFSRSPQAGSQLCFCSENVSDFGLELQNDVVLHPLLKDGLPPTKFVRTLRDAAVFCKSSAKVVEPSAEAIEAALEEKIRSISGLSSCTMCNAARVVGQFCHVHFQEHLEKLPLSERANCEEALRKLLRTLSYMEREIFKLRTGLLSDGFVYTLEECAHIFKCSRKRIQQVEGIAIRKLQQPTRLREIVGYL